MATFAENFEYIGCSFFPSYIKKCCCGYYFLSCCAKCFSFTIKLSIALFNNTQALYHCSTWMSPCITITFFTTQLRRCTRMRSQSVGFRFCCYSKRGIKKKEPEIFSRVFPSVPLVSLEVNGELGWDTLNVLDDSEDASGLWCLVKITKYFIVCF